MKPIRWTMGNKMMALVLVASCAIVATPAHAQLWKKLQKKLEDKASDKADNVLNGKQTQTTSTSTSGTGTSGTSGSSGRMPYEEETFSFAAGSKLYYEDSLSNDVVGRMPKHWKTHSSGSVATVPGAPGKWLKMESNSSYRLDTLLEMPKNFTLEFDLLTRSDEAADLHSIHFGFSHDNSARSYIYGVESDGSALVTSLMFYYNDVSNKSYETNTENSLSFPLKNFSNSIIHVSIAVRGEEARVYINRSKLLDSRVFTPGTSKYFYISTNSMNNNARAYISNLKIAE